MGGEEVAAAAQDLLLQAPVPLHVRQDLVQPRLALLPAARGAWSAAPVDEGGVWGEGVVVKVEFRGERGLLLPLFLPGAPPFLAVLLGLPALGLRRRLPARQRNVPEREDPGAGDALVEPPDFLGIRDPTPRGFGSFLLFLAPGDPPVVVGVVVVVGILGGFRGVLGFRGFGDGEGLEGGGDGGGGVEGGHGLGGKGGKNGEKWGFREKKGGKKGGK